MLKLTITDNGKTLTLYVANNAFDGIESYIPHADQPAILTKLAARMLHKLVKEGESEAVYLEKISFPIESPNDAQVVFYAQSEQYKIKHDKSKSIGLRNAENSSAPAFSTEIMIIPSDAEELLPIICAQAQPPVELNDDVVNGQPLQGEEVLLATQDTLRSILRESEISEVEAEEIVGLFANGAKQNLTKVLSDEIVEDRLPQNPVIANELQSIKDYISRESKIIDSTIVQTQNRIFNYLCESHAYFVISDTLATALYNAAKDYYLSRWAAPENRGNIDNLQNEREAFNRLFAGVAKINADFTLSPVQNAINTFRQKNTNEIESFISNLLNTSYVHVKGISLVSNQNWDAIDYIAKRLNDLGPDYSEKKISRQATAHHFVLANKYKTAHQNFDDSKSVASRLLNDRQNGLPVIQQLLTNAKNKIKDDARELLSKLPKKQKKQALPTKPATKPPTRNFWQRNKATILSIGLGVLAAAAIAVAIVLTVGTGGTMPFIIAGAAAAAVGISVIVGRVADYFRGRKQQREAANAETASLLHQDNFDSPQPRRKLSTTAQIGLATDGISAALDGKDDDSDLSFGAGNTGPMFGKKPDQTTNKSVTPAPVSGQNNNNARK